MEYIYIVTAHTGYNYGTYLQAFAMKKLLGEFGDNVDIIWEKSFGPEGRDFRLKKIIVLALRMAVNYKHAGAIKQGYKKNLDAEPNDVTKQMFNEFGRKYLDVKEYRMHELKRLASSKQTKAVVCGSDQIWNASSMYPDPLYYLQFVPVKKRIAYAPSLGRTEIPKYNRARISRYIKSIHSVSVREEEGARIIKGLIGRNVPVMPDPTLVVEWSEWMGSLKEKYLLLYFLDSPRDGVISDIKQIKEALGANVKILLHHFKIYDELDDVEYVNAGPKEFVELISKAMFVCTDSFHATVFSLLSKTKMYVYERNYGQVDNQNSRIENLLNHYSLQERLRKKLQEPICLDYSMEHIESIRREDIKCARTFIKKALNGGRR